MHLKTKQQNYQRRKPVDKGPKVTVIIDGQYGSCGKGVICGYLANEFDVAVRVGAPNAGHTLKVGDNIWKMQQIPVAGLVNPDITLCIGPAGLISMDVFEREVAYIKDPSRIMIDRNAGILEHKHMEQEQEENMFKKIGSTCEGVGAALRDKIKRDGTFRTAKDVKELSEYIADIATFINTLPDTSKVMIEGTQGFALSLNHGPYPYCTSRDVLA
jgi:adenylosuccinate synthase